MKASTQALVAWLYLGRAETLAWPWQLVGRYVLFVAALYLLVRAGPLVDVVHLWPALDFVPWVLLGVAALDLAVTGMLAGPWRLRQLQRAGVLEPCMMSRVPVTTQLLVLGIPSGLHGLARAFTLALLAAALHGHLDQPAVLLAMVSLLLLIWLVHYVVGLLSMAIVLVIEGHDLIGRGLALLSAVGCGALLPSALVGAWLSSVGAWLPLAPGVLLLREALVAEEVLSVAALTQLVGTGLLLLPAALFCLHLALARVRAR